MKRYREDLDEVVVTAAGASPAGFCWRGRRYDVIQVLGHWHEDAGWWHRSGGVTLRVERTDLWRVEARGVGAGGSDAGAAAQRGVYELVRRRDRWRLDRVWD